MGGLVGEITAASAEKARGIEQINKALSEMYRVVRQSAANAEKTASVYEEMPVAYCTQSLRIISSRHPRLVVGLRRKFDVGGNGARHPGAPRI